MQQMIPNRKEKGFTLIELVMVIVILGILAAFALPRFADLGGDARRASLEGALGAVKSASGIVRAQVLAKGDTGTTTLEGTSITLSNGYATADSALATNGSESTFGIADAAQLSANDFDLTYTSGDNELEVSLGNCAFTYTEATTSAAPVISAIVPATGDC